MDLEKILLYFNRNLKGGQLCFAQLLLKRYLVSILNVSEKFDKWFFWILSCIWTNSLQQIEWHSKQSVEGFNRKFKWTKFIVSFFGWIFVGNRHNSILIQKKWFHFALASHFGRHFKFASKILKTYKYKRYKRFTKYFENIKLNNFKSHFLRKTKIWRQNKLWIN